MTIPSRPTNQDPQSQWLWYILEKLDRILKTLSLGSGGSITIADGADVTLGSKADAKNSATDTTPVSEMSVLKQISASIQTLGNVNGHPQSKPDYFDITTSTTIVYEGWKSGVSVILCKTDLTTGTRTWGTDSWTNRIIAIYS